MRSGSFRAGPTCTTVLTRTTVWVAAAVLMASMVGVPAATAAPGADSAPGVAPSDLQMIARQLAARADIEPGESCGPDSSQLAMFDGSGGFAAARQFPGPAVHAGSLQVMCALPFTTGRPGGDCTGKHNLQWQIFGDGQYDKVTAELMGLDASGTLLQSYIIAPGSTAQLASRMSQADWKFAAGKNKDYTVFAPIPLLKVTVEDGGQKAVAFCSNIPWVDVIEPSGGVVTEDNGGSMNVLAAIPRTDPTALHLLVDGVDILQPGAGVVSNNPTECSAHTPCDGTVGGVTVTGLVVDVASGIGVLSSNTIRATLSGLSCGGHFVRVTTSMLPGALRNPTSEQCQIDDLTEKGGFSVFAVRIDSPVPNEQLPLLPPVGVLGEVCAGTQIVAANINGKSLPTAGQVCVAGNGETVGDLCTLAINTTLGETDLATDLVDSAPSALGTFDAGTNRLVASAREVFGNRAYKRFVFSTGPVAPIGIAAGATLIDPSGAVFDPNALVFQQAAVQTVVNNQLKLIVEENIAKAQNATETVLQNAFLVSISAEGSQELFDKLCTTPLNDPASPFNGMTPGQIFSSVLTDKLNDFTQSNPLVNNLKIELPDACTSCDPSVDIWISDVTIGTDVACPIDFEEGQFRVAMDLPDIFIEAKAYGQCQTDACVCVPFTDECACTCVARSTVDMTTSVKVENISLGFIVTEANLENFTTDQNPVFDPGGKVELGVEGGLDLDCIGGELCQFAVDIIEFILDEDDLLHIDIQHQVDFAEHVKANEPDPVGLNELKIDEQVVAGFFQKIEGGGPNVEINEHGIIAGLEGTFATTQVDLSIPANPGIALTPAPIPSLPIPNAEDVLIGLSDDAINMMFASLTAAGNLKVGDAQGCFSTGVTIDTLLPANCDSLDLGNDFASAGARGYCHAVKGHDCESLTYLLGGVADGFLTSTEQGVCHGAAGHICTDTFGGDLVQLGACAITPNFNLQADQGLLICAKGDLPPRMLFPNDGTPSTNVPTKLRLGDLTVALVIDRHGNADGSPDGQVTGLLADAPSCFAPGVSNAVDCNVFAACLDLNFNFRMNSAAAASCGGKPGFKATFESVQIEDLELGVVCQGGTSPTTDEEILDSASDENTITIPLATEAGQVSPDICGAGLDFKLGAAVSCVSGKILAIEAEPGTPAKERLRDYLAITCDIQ